MRDYVYYVQRHSTSINDSVFVKVHYCVKEQSKQYRKEFFPLFNTYSLQVVSKSCLLRE